MELCSKCGGRPFEEEMQEGINDAIEARDRAKKKYDAAARALARAEEQIRDAQTVLELYRAKKFRCGVCNGSGEDPECFRCAHCKGTGVEQNTVRAGGAYGDS